MVSLTIVLDKIMSDVFTSFSYFNSFTFILIIVSRTLMVRERLSIFQTDPLLTGIHNGRKKK